MTTSSHLFEAAAVMQEVHMFQQHWSFQWAQLINLQQGVHVPGMRVCEEPQGFLLQTQSLFFPQAIQTGLGITGPPAYKLWENELVQRAGLAPLDGKAALQEAQQTSQGLLHLRETAL